MTRNKVLITGVIGGIAIIGSLGIWKYTRRSAETRADSATSGAPNVAAISVQVERPERQSLSRPLLLPGSIEAFEEATLYAKTAGYLRSIKVDIGDRVQKGEVLAEIDVPEMAREYDAAEADVQRAKANVTNAQAEAVRAEAEAELKKITYERLKTIREQEPDVLPQQGVDEAKAQYDAGRAMVRVAESKITVAQSEVARADASRARLATLVQYSKIRAPFSGIVIKRYVDRGALIQQAMTQTNVSPIVTVAGVDRVRVFVDVPEPEVPFVKKGISAAVTVDALPGKVFAGACSRFANALDPKTRTMRTEIDIPNPGGMLRPGMYGRVNLTEERRENVLTLSAPALISEPGKTYVYTVIDGIAKRVEIKTGLDDGIRVEITEGLTGEELVIVAGKGGVRDGIPVIVSQAPR